MKLSMYNQNVFDNYKSNSQRIRVMTEQWMNANMFCPVCSNNRIAKLPNNTPISDFSCPNCSQQFQLKSQKADFGNKITDGAYRMMINSILNNQRPNFLLMNYGLDYFINNLFLVPFFFFTESAIEKRKPLSSNARRAGWVGCNILLSRIPPEGKIKIIENKALRSKEAIAMQWKKISFMQHSPLEERGWTSDVLRAVHSIGNKEFGLNEVYSLEDEFAKSHPKNYHIKDKIRQQLQILRDRGILQFLGKGKYRIRD